SYVDTMVTVVDASNFFHDFGSPELLVDRALTDIAGDDRTIVNLLTDQVEFANVIVLNKVDLVDAQHLGILRSTLHRLNPSARIIETNFSEIDPKSILHTGLFDFEKAEESAGWIEELNKEEHTPETEEYGIGSFVFRSSLPFHPERFWTYFHSHFPANIIRSKGLFWIASRPDQALIWGQAGGSIRTDSAGVWWASMSFGQRADSMVFLENQKEIEANWDPTFGDRKVELVFIGQNLDEQGIRRDLEACLLQEEDLSHHWTTGYPDTWPVERTS
ncbi:MAG: GTP-binding protein, partial [Flavobacteriales bacterium]|nr:GTP-binding protein [Flavobacteriales bacterium]